MKKLSLRREGGEDGDWTRGERKWKDMLLDVLELLERCGGDELILAFG